MSRAINLRQYVTDPLERIRCAQGLDDETVDVPPDQEDAEGRYEGVWRVFLALPDDS